MKKRIVSLLLAVLMVTGTFPVQVFAADENISVELESSETTPCDICGNEVCTCESTGEEGEQTEEPEQPEEPVEEEKYAVFNPDFGIFTVRNDVTAEDDYVFYIEDFEENTIVYIADYCFDSNNDAEWYQVEFYSGGVVEEYKDLWPAGSWVLYNYTVDGYETDALLFVDDPEAENPCEICGKNNCDLVHFYCDICEKYDCGVTHPYCVICEKVDCGVKHTYCGHCGAIDCEIEHEDLYTPETAPIIPENPTLPEGEEVSVVDEFGDSVSEGIYLSEGEKASFSAWADDASSYQWQVCYNNANDLWIDIYGANGKGILVSPAMFLNIIDYQGETYLRCVVTTGEETVIGEAIPVTVLEAIPVEEAPMMYAARTTDSGDDIEAQADDTATTDTEIKYTITIKYIYAYDKTGELEGKEASHFWTASLPAGGNYTIDVPFPDVPGYKPGEINNNAIEDGVDGITERIVNIQSDRTITVEYVPDYVDFKVEHYWQKIDSDEYEFHEETIVTGLKTGQPVSDAGKDKIVEKYPGFRDLIYDSTITVAADGSTVVKVYYDRNYYMVGINLNGGYGAEPMYARYGTPIVISVPKRAGHTFKEWSPALPATVPAENTEYTATWMAAEANFTVAFYYENANNTNYTYVGSVQKTGTTGETINGATYKDEQYDGYKADYAKHFTYSHYQEGVTVKEDGTAVVNLYFSRNKYTLTYYEFVCPHIKNNEHNGDCCTLTAHTHTSDCCSIHVHTKDSCIKDTSVINYETAESWIRDAANKAYPNAKNGQKWSGKKSGQLLNRYAVYFDGVWYTRGTNTNQIEWNSCGGNPQPPHAHGDGNCNTSNCSVGYEHTHGNGCNTDKCAHLNASYFKCPCITLDSNNHIQENLANWKVVYQGNHKYEEDVGYIHQQMEGSEGYRWVDMYIGGVLKEPYGNGGALGSFTSMPGGTTVFCRSANGDNPFRMIYWLETTDGSGTRTFSGRNFAKGTTFYNKMSYVAWSGDYVEGTPQGFEPFEATFGDADNSSSATDTFTNYLSSSNPRESRKEWNNFYYIRKTFNLEYFNGSTKVATRSMKYDEVLKEDPYCLTKEETEVAMVSPYGDGYEFGGWYLDPTCTVEVDWGTTRMPDGGMAVYAKWTPITRSINVTVDEGNGAVTTEYAVSHGSAIANPPEDPERDGYTFVGWFYMDPTTQKETAFHFSMPVYRDMNLYAKWTSDTLATGKVYYKIQGTNTEIAQYSDISGSLGSTKTYSAKIGDELYEAYRSGYFPTEQSHNVQFSSNDGQNEYTFYYVEMEAVNYTVRFIDTATGEAVIDLDGNTVEDVNGTSKNGKILVDLTSSEYSSKNIRGYTIDAMSKEFVLSSDPTLNVFNFYYTRDEENATVQIEHYIRNVADTDYIHYFTEPVTKAKIGTVVTANPMTIDGFRYFDHDKNGEKLTDAGVVIKLYYTRNSYNYTFKFCLDETTTELANPVTGTEVYGKTVNQRAKDIPGYKLLSANTMSVTVGSDNDSNVRTFYYEEEEVTIKYQVGAIEGGSVSSPLETIGAVGTAQGSTAAVKDENYVFVGWFDNYAGNGTALSTDQKFVPSKATGEFEGKTYKVYESDTYYAIFAEVQVDINYVATTGGSVSPATEKVDVVTGVATGSAAAATDQYEFVGWFDNENCEDTALSTAESFKPIRPDEGWGSGKTYYAKFAEKTATINYVAVGGGSVSSESETVDMVSGKAVGATATFDANIVEFLGWFDNANGEGTALSTDVKFTPTTDSGWAETQTYYAVFDSIEYNITFVDRGNVISTGTYNVGDTLTLPTNVVNGKYVVSWKVAETNGNWTDDDVENGVIERYGNVTIEAEWTINIYWVKEDIATNPGEDSIYGISENVIYGNEPATFDVDKNTEGHQDPTKAPTAEYTYEFAGWADYTIPGERLGVIAKIATFEEIANVYTIKFVDGDDENTVYLENELAYGSGVTAPANPTKTGYTFADWDIEIPATMPAENVTIKAQWNVNQYTITFDLDGGNIDGNTDAVTKELDYNTAVTKPKDPVKEGYTFTVWSPAVPATMPAENITVKAQWKINEYTVTFKDGFGNTISSEEMEYGAKITYPGNQSREGYTFTGWDKTVATVPAEDVTVTAKWNVNQYTITFNTDGGTAIAPIKQNYGTTVTEPDDPTKEGYTFVKWDKTIPAIMPAEDMTITAEWKINQYTITFDTDGGSAVAPITQDYKTVVTKPADPTKTGYTFAGWSPEVPATMPAENMTVKALWTVNKYTVTLVYDEEQVTVNKEGFEKDSDGWKEVFDYDSNVNLDFDPILGYQITNVSINGAPLGTSLDWNIKNYAIQADTRIVVTSKPVEYTITFDTDGGSAVAPITQDYKTVVTKPADPTKTGYTFKGWSPEVPATMPAENITVKAQWEINQYTITFDTDGGTPVASMTQDYNTAVTAPADPTKTGYTFKGWSPEVPATMPAENITVKAQWEINQYTITFNTDGGSAVAPITQDYNTAVTAPADPTKTGYTFAGWDTEIPDNMPAEDMTITAKWTVNQYTITFNTDGGTAIEPIKQDYNTAVTAPTNPTKTGYTFSKWVRVDAEGKEIGDYTIPATMPAENVDLKAIWTANKDTPYKVQHWQQNIDAEDEHNAANFTLTDTDNLTGTTAEEVTPEVKPYIGFKAPDTQTVKIAADGNTVVNYYYIRNEYEITWLNDDDSLIDITTVDHGEVPTHADPSKPATAQYTYTFTGWTPAVVAATGNAEYKATYSSATNVYTVTWKNEDGTVLETDKNVPYGTMPSYDGATPTKASKDQYDYTFAGWSTDPAPVEGNITYTATFTPYENFYTITWVNHDGTELEVDTNVAWNDMPEYNGATPVKTGDAQYSYTFKGWNPEKVAVKGNTTYTAVFEQVTNKYTMRGSIANGTVSDPMTVDYGNYAHLVFKANEGYEMIAWDIITSKGTDERTFTNPSGGPWNYGIQQLKEDTTIKVYTAPIEYTITYNGLEGAVIDENPAKYTIESDNITLNKPTKVGYTFAGWTGTGLSEATEEVIIPKGSTDNREYTATWTANNDTEYKVEHWQQMLGKGTEQNADNYSCILTEESKGTTAEEVSPEVKTYEGFTSPATQTVVISADGNTVVKYYYTRNKYDVIFNNGYGSDIHKRTMEYGADINYPVDPVRTGYTFNGWDSDIKTVPATDIIITAQWKINQYTITFDTVGGSAVAPITQNYNTAVTAPADPTKEGYTFAGWDTEVPATMPAENMTITAKWTVNQYTITFDTVGGSAVAPITQNYNTAVTAPADPTKEGYTFAGWDKEIPETMPAENMTITAKWTINQYTITFNTDGGTAIDAITQNYNTAVTAPANPTKTGYTFQNWVRVDAEGKEIGDYTIPRTMPAENVNLKAKWTVNSYTIEYDLDEGNWTEGASKPESYTVEDKLTVTDPARPGYKFIGWAVSSEDVNNWDESYTNIAGLTKMYGDVKLTAQWERSLVDLTIITNSYNSEQSFIFTVTGTPSDESYGTVTLEVVLVGTDEITIKDLPVGIYIVTEKDGWSWRESTVGSIEADITTGSKTVEFVFGTVDNVYWLSGYSYNKRRKGRG